MIKSFIIDIHLGWDQNLQFLSSAYRANVQESKGMTSNLIILAREIRLPFILFIKRTVAGHKMLANKRKKNRTAIG